MIRATELAAERPASWINDEHFPTSLVAFVIKTYSQPGARVLDPFAGSGTTLAVAEHLGRQAVGVELLADRVAMARARVDDPSCVIQGDALHLDQLALGTFDLCLTSPPYMSAVNHLQNPLTGYQTADGKLSAIRQSNGRGVRRHRRPPRTHRSVGPQRRQHPDRKHCDTSIRRSGRRSHAHLHRARDDPIDLGPTSYGARNRASGQPPTKITVTSIEDRLSRQDKLLERTRNVNRLP